MATAREPRRLSVILSIEEIARLLAAAPGLKAKAALSVSYGIDLRASEVVAGLTAEEAARIEATCEEVFGDGGG